MQRIPMTSGGFEALQAELKILKSEERPNIIAAISEARSHGDLSENAEYHAARERQSFNEGRIMEFESKLSLAEVIDPSTLSGPRVVFGATVTIIDAETEETRTYQIVGVDEADSKENKISVTSPIARALIGKSVGDEVTVRSPKGETAFEIAEVQFR
jgi:transcription elongation factor GreA